MAITGYEYREAGKQVVFSFEPLENNRNTEQRIAVTVRYQDVEKESELVLASGSNHVPEVKELTIENISPRLGQEPHVKGMLKVNYTFSDEDQDVEGDTKFQWYMADTRDGEYTPIQGIRTRTIILLDQYVGKYLKCEVTPADIHGNCGEAVLSEAAGQPVMDTEGLIVTLGQNSGNYCAPNPVYDKYMREAGLLKEGEANPKTVSMENDLPMKMADALAKYDIRLMLYLPSNPPHSVSWDETGTPDGYGYFSDYAVTKRVFDYTPGYDGVPTQKGRKVLSEMIEWWSKHYGDKVSGWWFDGMFYGGIFESQTDMSNEYNVATLANAAKAGNPYSILTFSQGLDVNYAFEKSNDYQDFTGGESQGLNTFPVNGRWAAGSDDRQNFIFGPLGNRNNWSAGWGCKGTSRTSEFLENVLTTSIRSKYVMGFDTKVNVSGDLEPTQLEQLKAVKKAVLDHIIDEELTGIDFTEELTLQCVGDRGILQYNLKPEGVWAADIVVQVDDPEIVQVIESINNTIDVVAKKAGTTGAASGRPVDADGFHEFNDTVHYTQETGAKVDISFEGTGFDLIGGYNTDQGEISVQVDNNEPVVVDTSVPGGAPKKSFGLVLYSHHDLEPGNHTVTITKMESGQFMIIDAIRTYHESRIDKTALEDVYNKYKDQNSAGYTKETWDAFTAALEQAKAVLEDPEADQAAIDEAAAGLTAAAEGLRISKKTLEKFLNQAKEHEANGDASGCIESVQQLFAQAIAEAEAVMALENPTYGQVQDATYNLMLAIHALELKAGDKTDLIMALEFTDTIDLNRYVTAGQAEYLAALVARGAECRENIEK